MKTKYKKLLSIYKKIPAIDCKGLCHPSCTIVMAEKVEINRVVDATGCNPFKHSRFIKKLESGLDIDDAGIPSCKALKDGRCSIYHFRPTICRLYGVAEGLECQFGCVPDRSLSRIEASAILREVAEL